MEDVSISKGVFVYAKNKVGQRKNLKPDSHKSAPWYQAFKETWLAIETAATEVNTSTFRQILLDLKNFVSKVKDLPSLADEIPTGILLAGVNLPDHNLLLQNLVSSLEPVTPYIATVWSRDVVSLKNLIEESIYQIINGSREEDDCIPEVKKTQCTLCTLHAWHRSNNNGETPFVIIIPDFESFSARILHDFILILSSYLKSIKFVLIFGVATTLHVVHRSLSYDATSKLNIKVFHTQTQVTSLTDMLDNVVLSTRIPFKLINRAFKLLVEMFLYYDFSVHSFLQSYKVCMWKHFYNTNETIICCSRENIKARVARLTAVDLRYLRKYGSIEKHLKATNKSGVTDDELKSIIAKLLHEFHDYIDNFFVVLKCLHQLTITLPGPPFGRNFREIYERAVVNKSLCETTAYKQAIQHIGFLSKEELLANVNSMLSTLRGCESTPRDIIENLEYHVAVMKEASLDLSAPLFMEPEPSNAPKSRLQWKESLKEKSLNPRSSPYKEAQLKFIKYLDEQVFTVYLKNIYQVPLYEIFCYDDSHAVNHYIKGSMKAAIYNALNDPHHYFGCKCCRSNGEILPTHPDLNIVFKLHLESRKMINLYDWLQSFLTVIDPSKIDEEQEVDPLLHARFTRAVAELQFLGFIKATKKKTDHVKRLTT